MSREIPVRAFELATGERAESIGPLAMGRSSTAWLVESPAATRVVRVPIERSGRRATYRAESLIAQHLAASGHAVATWNVEIEGQKCCVGARLAGTPVNYGADWTIEFGQRLASLLADLHSMSASGFGPLADGNGQLRGSSTTRRSGIVDRWFHATVWPFDGSTLREHPVMNQDPSFFDRTAPLGDGIVAAETGPAGVVHSDLHREHLLANTDRSLAGVLDFGAAFVGAIAWDFAVLNWYYGRRNAGLVAKHYPNGAAELARGCMLSIAVGLYKIAKNPDDPSLLPRLRRCVDDLGQTG